MTRPRTWRIKTLKALEAALKVAKKGDTLSWAGGTGLEAVVLWVDKTAGTEAPLHENVTTPGPVLTDTQTGDAPNHTVGPGIV
jgi:hypothetical protein